MITMLNEIAAREVLQSARVARLGCIVNGEPYVVPISCHLEDDSCFASRNSQSRSTPVRDSFT